MSTSSGSCCWSSLNKLHDQRDGGVEVPARLEIVGHALERLMGAPYEQLFLGRGGGQVNLRI